MVMVVVMLILVIMLMMTILRMMPLYCIACFIEQSKSQLNK